MAQLRARLASGADPLAPLFPTFSSRRFAESLRVASAALGVPDATWHALRRGHASDLIASGAPLAQVLVQGGWRSSAFLRYIVRSEGECVAVSA